MTTATPTIHVLMGRVLAELPAIGKGDYNQQQKFHFRGIDAVLNALNPMLAKHGVFYVPDVVERMESERETRGGSAMYVVNLHVRYRFYGPAGDYVEASAWGEGTDMGDKATNKAMTGAMKYVLFQVFAISTAEASDADAETPAETVARPRPAAGYRTPPAAPANGAGACGTCSQPLGTDPVARSGGVLHHRACLTSPAPVPPQAGPPPAADNGPRPTGAGSREEVAAEGAHPPAAAPPGDHVSTAQVRLMHVLLSKLGVGEDDKHRYCSELIGLPEWVDSLNDLSKRDGRALIDALKVEAGEPAK